MPKRPQLRGYDLRQIDGYAELIGVDEAGRGALAGPVVAGAVLVTKNFLESRWAVANANRINDSKQLTAPEREALWFEFETLMAEGLIHATYGAADVREIEQLNILGATKLAMRRALEQMHPPTAFQFHPRARPFRHARGDRRLHAGGQRAHPDRRPPPAQFSLPAHRRRQGRLPLALHRHGLDHRLR